MRTISGQVSKKIFLMISEINPIIGYVKEMMGFSLKGKNGCYFMIFFTTVVLSLLPGYRNGKSNFVVCFNTPF